MIDKRPALIARCRDTTDVVAAVHLAQKRGLEVAVRTGGQAVAGMSSCEDGLVIDLGPMKEISIDPALRRARVSPGVTWGEFDAAAQEFGLATTGGRVSTTGVSDLTLGGGSGWLERKHGLACDNLISVEMVTADGSVLTASGSMNTDLFWALHGGGGNFGVVTSLEFRLHPVGPTVLAGLLLWPGIAGSELVHCFRDFAVAAPEELGSAVGFVTAPPEEFVPKRLQGMICGAVALCYAGPVGEGEAVLKALRTFGPPEADLIRAMPYASFQSMLDDANPPGLRNYATSDYLNELSDGAIDTFVSYAARMPCPHTRCFLIPWGGAVARVAEDDAPLAPRDAAWVAHALVMWREPAENDEHIGWARAFSADMARFTSAYSKQYDRLAEIKAKYDPHNLFRLGLPLRSPPASETTTRRRDPC